MQLGAETAVITTGARNTGLVLDVSETPGGLYRIRGNLNRKRYEAPVPFALPDAGMTTRIGVTPASYFKTGGGGIVRREIVAYSGYDGHNILPKAAYSDRHTWTFASGIVGFDQFDHQLHGTWQLQPGVTLLGFSVFPRGAVFPQVVRDPSPFVSEVPRPLFFVTTDGGASYGAVSLDNMFTDVLAFTFTSSGQTTHPGAMGRGMMERFKIQSLPEHHFISFLAPLALPDSGDPPTAHYIQFFGLDYRAEPRFYRVDGTDFTRLTATPVPPGFGTVWTDAMVPAFAVSAAAASADKFNALGYQVRPIDPTDPALLFATFDMGSSWEAARSLPGTALSSGPVYQTSANEISVSMHEGGEITRYGSTDLGATWTKQQTLCRTPHALDALEYQLRDFNVVVQIERADGMPTTSKPMSPWLYDSRYKPITVRPT